MKNLKKLSLLVIQKLMSHLKKVINLTSSFIQKQPQLKKINPNDMQKMLREKDFCDKQSQLKKNKS